MKKAWKFLSSMRFAILLLLILAAACVVASFVTQGQSYDWYAATYSERRAALIMGLGLDDAFHSWWFLTITAFLCGNLLLCNLIRLKPLMERTRRLGDPGTVREAEATAQAEGIQDPAAVFRALSMPKAQELERDGRMLLFSAKNGAGLWGPWVCHLGILLLIFGFTLGQILHKEYVVYGVPGDTKAVGDTGYQLTIDDFRVDLREDGTVAQYTADITVFRSPQDSAAASDSRSAQISVNHPATLFGMKFYQNTTGYAARVTIAEGSKRLQDKILCAGEGMEIGGVPGLVVFFHAFYPDFFLRPGYGPMTLSSHLNNPAYLYSIHYQDRVVGMDYWLPADGPIRVNDFVIEFSEPQSFTLIQVKKDAFAWLALIGGLVTMAGLFLAFYLQPKAVWALKEEGGGWSVYGQSRKGGALFQEAFHQAAQAGKKTSKE